MIKQYEKYLLPGDVFFVSGLGQSLKEKTVRAAEGTLRHPLLGGLSLSHAGIIAGRVDMSNLSLAMFNLTSEMSGGTSERRVGEGQCPPSFEPKKNVVISAEMHQQGLELVPFHLSTSAYKEILVLRPFRNKLSIKSITDGLDGILTMGRNYSLAGASTCKLPLNTWTRGGEHANFCSQRATYDPGRGVREVSANFERVVLGCIEADFFKY